MISLTQFPLSRFYLTVQPIQSKLNLFNKEYTQHHRSRGLADARKRLDVLERIKSDKTHIACLQDVHLKKRDRAKLRGEWGGNVYLSAKTSLARGVAILIRRDLEYKVHNALCDEEGNYVMLDIAIEGLPHLTLVSL